MPSEPSSVIGPGDVLEIALTAGYEDKGIRPMLVRVGETGIANISLIGEVMVAGLEPTEAEQSISTVAVERGVFRHPHVTVLIKRKFANRVTVVGAVESPGVKELDRGSSDLLGAIAAAGGLTEEAGAEVQVLRKRAPQRGAGAAVSTAAFEQSGPSPKSERIHLIEATSQGLSDLRLHDGDVVMVYEDEPRVVNVMGLVREPKQLTIPPDQDLTVLAAIARAGGRTVQLADRVLVIRQLPGQPEPIEIEVSVREAKKNGAANLLLAPNDIVTVEETPTTFVLGALQNLVRFGVSGTTPLF
jgi:polysaccharide export outer membrane protein